MRSLAPLTDSSRISSRMFNIWLIVVMLLAFTSFDFARPAPTIAAPSLNVSTSVTPALLGGTATVSITVANVGDEKGYNLSVDSAISSSLLDPNGTVTIGESTVDPTTESFNPSTGDTSLEFIDMVDLAPTESYSFSFEVDISGDSSWEVGELILAAATAHVNEYPDNSGAWIDGSDSDQGEVIPIDLVSKTANQSTGVQQDLGTETRPYTYTILIQNNYTNPSESVVVTDTLPDGVEFLGIASGPALDAGFGVHDPATGKTALQWTLGDLIAGETVEIVYDAGLRYDYYGTDNGGNNRPTAFFDGSWETTSAIIDHKTGFTNTAGLVSEYQGSLATPIFPTDSDSAAVEGTYITINKSSTSETGTLSAVGYGAEINYTLTYATSQYYTADSIDVTDTLPDGLTYVVGSASIEPSSVTEYSDGTTDIVWAGLPALGQTEGSTITFKATMDSTWQDPAYVDQPIRAGDSMTNVAILGSNWHDQVNPPRNGVDVLVASVSAGLATGLPEISKEVWDPALGAWTDTIDAQVGDELLYRARFNTNDGVDPIRSDISLGYITLTDWVPPGTVYNHDANPSYEGTFSVPATPTPPAINMSVPTTVTLGSLTGYQWFLGDVSANGWWETTFTVTVQDVPVVQEGLKTGNHWKLTGINTFGSEYSDRDIADLMYVEPNLVLDKSTGALPSPLIPGTVVPYTITIDNSQSGVAEDVLVTDTLPLGMLETTPTITAITLNTTSTATPLVENVDYTTSYDSGTGVWLIDLHDGTIDTPIPGGGTLVIDYDAVIDTGLGAGITLNDIATVSYDTQPDGTGRAVPGTGNTADPNTDDAEIQLAPLSIAKTGDAGPVTIGETVHYDITVTVPDGMIAYWPRIVDEIDQIDGMYYVPGSASITDTGGTPLTAAAFESTSTPTRANLGNNVTQFTWELANPIDNSSGGSAYEFVLSYDMLCTAVEEDGDQELWASPFDGTDAVRNNWVRIDWDYADSGSRDASYNEVTQNNTDTDTSINQPVLTLSKSSGAPITHSGSQVVTYTMEIKNTGAANAYDITWDDTLPTYLTHGGLVSATHSSAGDISASITDNFAANPATIDFGAISLAPDETISLVTTAIVDPNVQAGIDLENTADVDWSSLPGSIPGERVYNDDPTWESGYVAD
ncbi:MAG: hypothetical protein PF636_01495, partial [Actinomycetota bacterium]|nr:hypothetical protein [Actinomycetota bacterium]